MTSRNFVLILEDNHERVERFESTVKTYDPKLRVRVWLDAHSMIAELDRYLDWACLISLDHDLVQAPGAKHDPGSGQDVAGYLAKKKTACPAILHSSNYERVWSMHNEMSKAGWQMEKVGPIGEDWIETAWLPKLRTLLQSKN